MPKQLAAEQIKTVINTIQEGPKDWKELKALKIRGKPIPEKSLHRILTEYLGPWGLIFKDEDDGKWSWFLRKRIFENHDAYELALKHSKWLVFGGERPGNEGSHQGIGALYALARSVRMFPTPGKPFLARDHCDYQELQAFFQHIKTGYPQIYQKFEEHAGLVHQREELMQPIIAKDPNINMMGMLDTDINRTFCPQGWELSSGPGMEIEKESRLKRLHVLFTEEQLNRLGQVIKKTMSVEEETVSQLSLVFFKIEQGTPLKGYCQTCPDLEVSIKQ